MHTAAAVMQGVEDGTWALEDPITAYAPGFEVLDGDTDALTLHWLMTHHGALPDVLTWQCRQSLESYFTQDYGPNYYGSPSYYYNYSNSGWNLLGYALEQVNAQSFPTLMKERVLEPAGMETATFDPDDVPEEVRATGYGWSDDPWPYPLDTYDCPRSRPAAWLHGTVEDLARMALVHLESGGEVLAASSVEAMHAQEDTHWFADGSFQVGYGQFSQDYKGVQLVHHDGWVTGFVSELAVVPEDDFGVVVVANSDAADVRGVRDAALDAFLDLDPDEETTPDGSTDPSTWDVYAGQYDDPYVWGDILVTHTDSGLTLEMPYWELEVPMYQYNGDAFWFEWREGSGYWYLMRFIFEEGQDTPTWFVVREGVGVRSDGRAGPGAPPRISPEAMKARVKQTAHRGRPDSSWTPGARW